MLEDKLARIRTLMKKRDEIDAELAAMLGMSAPTRRGRPRKDQSGASSVQTVSEGHSVGVSFSTTQSTGNGSDAE